MDNFVDRQILPSVLAALARSPVVLLNGARQSGKTTLAGYLANTDRPVSYTTLDDFATLARIRENPTAFLADQKQSERVIVDEIQRAPALFPAIKTAVDRRPRPGRYLLLSSVKLPELADLLGEKMEILTLWPLSQGEIFNTKEDFIDAAFGEAPLRYTVLKDRPTLLTTMLKGGYPALLGEEDWDRRQAWFKSYIDDLIQHDVRDLADIEGLTALPRLLALLAARSAASANFAELSRRALIPLTTLKRYLTLLEATLLVQFLPAWSDDLGTRLVKAPKIVLNDVGLITHLLNLTKERAELSLELMVPVFESLVITEICKQTRWSSTPVRAFHFRTPSGREVDLVLEDSAGNLVGVDVKATSAVVESDFRGLKALASLVGPRFRRGVVVYGGSTPVRFRRKFCALPAKALWQSQQH